jgi:hypothetical protein
VDIILERTPANLSAFIAGISVRLGFVLKYWEKETDLLAIASGLGGDTGKRHGLVVSIVIKMITEYKERKLFISTCLFY